MPLDFPPDFFVEIPGGRYRLGLEPDEARRLAEITAEYNRAQEWPYKERQILDHMYELEHTIGNVDWLTEQLLIEAPARDVEIEPFAIARRPVTNDEFAAFIAERGGRPPRRWRMDRQYGKTPPGGDPVVGVSWERVQEFCEWAGARIPFEAEWERAARGPERRLFPWGNENRDLGPEKFAICAPLPADDRRRLATPDGLEMIVTGSGSEWCADLWAPPSPEVEERWLQRFEQVGRRYEPWGRVTKGAPVANQLHSAVIRRQGAVEDVSGGSYTFRIVRADDRQIPLAPPIPGWGGARPRIRAFEERFIRPAVDDLRAGGYFEFHKLHVFDEWDSQRGGTPDHIEFFHRLSDTYDKDAGARVYPVHDADLGSSTAPAWGIVVAAVSTETFRRVIRQHGIFLWNLLYKLDGDRILARPFAFYRMNYDRDLHRMVYQFREGEEFTDIDLITPEMIRVNLGGAFRFYEQWADANRPPW